MMEDLHKIGGLPAVLKYLLKEGKLHGDCLTVTGKTLAENVETALDLDFDSQDIMRPLRNPIKITGHLQILYGNLAQGVLLQKFLVKKANFSKELLVFLMENNTLSMALSLADCMPVMLRSLEILAQSEVRECQRC